MNPESVIPDTGTPITDALYWKLQAKYGTGTFEDCVGPMGDLERQLAEARDTIEHLRMENGLIEFYQLKDQRDRLADALRDIRDESPAATVPQWILERIDEALATLDRKEES